MPTVDADALRRKASRRLVLAVALAVAAVGIFVGVAVSIASRTSAKIGNQSTFQLIPYSAGHRTAPKQVSLRRLGSGAPVVVGGDTGHPVVVNFFASWCTACQRELGAVAAVARTGVVPFIGVDTDDTDPGDALRLLRKAGATYPVGVGQGQLAEDYGTGNLPTTAFLNSKGEIVALALGALNRNELTHWVKDLLAGKPLASSAS